MNLFDSDFHIFVSNPSNLLFIVRVKDRNKKHNIENQTVLNEMTVNLDKLLRIKIMKMRIAHHFNVSMTSFSSDKKIL